MNNDPKNEQQEDFWDNHSKSWRSSGLTQMAYCAQAGISYSRFIYQHHRILSEARRSDMNFIKVKLGSTASNPPTAGIQLMLPNGVRVGVTNEVSAELLKTVLAIASGLAC